MIPLGILAAQAPPAPAGAYELISTTILASSASSVTFSSIPQDFKHLQIRAVTKSNSSDLARIYGQLNGVTSGVYTAHNLRGNGSTVTSNSTTTSATQMIDVGGFTAQTFFEGENEFGALVMDILDYSNTSKNTTLRCLSGFRTSSFTPYIFLSSGLYMQTTAVSSVNLFLNANSFVAGSRFSIYGLRG